jgi:putative hemolysin
MIRLEDPNPSSLVIGIALCLIALGIISAADTALITVSRPRLSTLLASAGLGGRRFSAHFLDEPHRIKSAIIFLNAALTITVTALTIQLTAAHGVLIISSSLVGLLFAILILSEVVAKALARRSPDATILLLARPLVAIATLLWPLMAIINLITRPLFTFLSGQPAPPTPLVTEEELRLMMSAGEEAGWIEHEEREMIEGVMDFGDTLVREIMIPRVDVVALEVNSSLDRALDVAITRGHSRIPVYEETIDNVIGILYAKDLIPVLRDGKRDTPLRDIIRPAHFVPATMKVSTLLEDLQRRRVHMAIVVDEYGGTAGIVTLEDLIEQIVGEIRDEYDTEEPSIVEVGPHELIVDARVTIDDVADMLEVEFPETTADRIGGLVYEQLGRIPRVGDQVICGDVTITVLSIKGIRAERLHIVRQMPAEVAAATPADAEKPLLPLPKEAHGSSGP